MKIERKTKEKHINKHIRGLSRDFRGDFVDVFQGAAKGGQQKEVSKSRESANRALVIVL